MPACPRPGIAVVADARTFLRVARRRVSSGVLARRAVRRPARGERGRPGGLRGWPARSTTCRGTGPGVHPGRVIATLNEVLPPQTIVTTDAGNFAGWAARGYRFRRPGTFLGPTSGAMGYGLPAAIAAALEHPGRPVVALAGDGGFAMTMSELETAVREGARVVAIVFDNARYGTIRVHQEGRGTGVGAATELGPVDFAAVARGLGARGVRVDDDAAFEPALRRRPGRRRADRDPGRRSTGAGRPSGGSIRPRPRTCGRRSTSSRPRSGRAGIRPRRYVAPSLETEGFIHCTDGAEAMVATANRHYRDDPRAFVVLTVDLDATGSPWRFDDPARIYPHVYGPIAPGAIGRPAPIPRAADGTFLPFGPGDVPAGVSVERIFVVEATYGPDAEQAPPGRAPGAPGAGSPG